MEGTIKKPHSKPGILSFSLSIFGIILFIGYWAFLYILMDGLLGFLFFVIPFLPLIALGLGIWGLGEKDRRKIFAILGVIIAILSGMVIWLVYFAFFTI